MCMGAPCTSGRIGCGQWVYPHVYGGTFASSRALRPGQGLSPCVWGHLTYKVLIMATLGSIPMCMGAPWGLDIVAFVQRVYPHVYGGTSSRYVGMRSPMGLSPCVWGHQTAKA